MGGVNKDSYFLVQLVDLEVWPLSACSLSPEVLASSVDMLDTKEKWAVWQTSERWMLPWSPGLKYPGMVEQP